MTDQKKFYHIWLFISVYVDSSTACNKLNMLLGTTAVGTTLATRSWTIRVTQLECGSDVLAPAGCTQYFYGSDSGTVNTYNCEVHIRILQPSNPIINFMIFIYLLCYL